MQRKKPEQQRAKATVDAILEAGKRLLVGDEPFSTNRIAEKAGVSIGSLYQYFPDKEGIAGHIYASYLADLYTQIEDWAHGLAGMGREAAISAIVAQIFVWQRRKCEFRRKLKGMLGPALVDTILSDAFTPRLMVLMERVVHDLAPHKSAAQKTQIRFLLTTVLPHLVHETFAKHPEFFSDAAYESTVRHMVEGFFDAEV